MKVSLSSVQVISLPVVSQHSPHMVCRVPTVGDLECIANGLQPQMDLPYMHSEQMENSSTSYSNLTGT